MLLELRNVRKRYQDTVVIPGLDLSVREGDFVGVIGPNGAGKTTAFGLISGGLRCDGGQVLLGGADVTRLDAAQRCHVGIGRTFQVPQPFVGMSVYENVLVAASFGGRTHGHEAQVRALQALQRCGLDAAGDQAAGTLTLLQRKRLELARAIATRPRLLLLDEVAGGLTEAETVQLIDLVRELHASGVTILWIEHLVHALMSVATRLVVLAEGALLSDGDPQAVINSRVVRDTYLGAELDLEAEATHVAH